MGDDDYSAKPSDSERLTAWQHAARPLMTRIVVGLALFFFVASLGQFAYLNWELAHSPTLDLKSLLDERICAAGPGGAAMDPDECLAAQRHRATVLLETNVVQRRYHQSNALLMFAVWSRYLGFVTGMILAVFGAAFILGKLAEPESQFGAAAPGGWKAEMRSTSPGLILAVLGVILIVTSIVTLHSLHTRDAPTYLMPGAALDDDSPIPAPDSNLSNPTDGGG